MVLDRLGMGSLGKRGGPRRCVYCHTSFGDDEPRLCETCFSAMHPACFAELRRCPTLGCALATTRSRHHPWRLEACCGLMVGSGGPPALAFLAVPALVWFSNSFWDGARRRRRIGPRTRLRFADKAGGEAEELELTLDLDVLAPTRLRIAAELGVRVYRGCEPEPDGSCPPLSLLSERRAYSEPGLTSIPIRAPLAEELWVCGHPNDGGAAHPPEDGLPREMVLDVKLELPGAGAVTLSYLLEFDAAKKPPASRLGSCEEARQS